MNNIGFPGLIFILSIVGFILIFALAIILLIINLSKKRKRP